MNAFSATDIVPKPHGSLLGSEGFKKRLVFKELVLLK
jgi:hypothetical protein